MTASSTYFRVVRADEPRWIVVEVPHAGLELDDEARRHTLVPPNAAALGALVEDADLGSDAIWEGSERVGVSRIVAHASRYVIDLNTNPRPPPQPPFYEEGLQSRSFIRRSHCGVNWTQPAIPTAEMERRFRDIFEPYHAAIDEALELARTRHGSTLLLASHSFPDRAGEHPDVVIGTLEGAAAPPEERAIVAQVFRDAGYSVGLEKPFRGGWSLQRHARLDEGVHAIQIELSRRLLTGTNDRGGVLREDCVSTLRAQNLRLVEALSRAKRAQ